jgi:hypothetical protein
MEASTMSGHYRIVNWKQFQHYNDRSPPWIKLHRSMLTSRTWVSASDSERVLAVACMLIAADTDNKIPADAVYLKRVAYLNAEPDFDALIRLQFIEFIDDDSTSLADASAPIANGTKCSSEERRGEKRREDTSAAPPSRGSVSRAAISDEQFLEFKLAYPERNGDYRWKQARGAINARIREGSTFDEILAGARRYAAYCKAGGKIGTEYVKQASSFIGTKDEKPFLTSWDVQTTGDAIPREERPDRFHTA